jgi:primosomal protein N' (replication factor Y)
VAVPRLALDRPFTYLLPDELDAGVGSLVSVPFHGRTVKAWVLGPATEVPEGQLLPVRRVQSSVRFFDQRMLQLLRWVSERYISPLATVIDRSHPPRVVSEEAAFSGGGAEARGGPAERTREAGGKPAPKTASAQRTSFEPRRLTWVRPLPGDEADGCVHAVEACLAAGRTAIVLVPEAEPMPFTARAVLDRFGHAAVPFLGGDPRERYRTWLEIQTGRYDVVVATRPGVFAPLPRLGLLWISREVHPGHREDRAPYYHVGEVAETRARLEDAACVVASFSPSVETAARIESGAVAVRRPPRAAERARAPLVEAVAPEAEDRSGRLARLLKETTSGALLVSRAGYGVARVCRSCSRPAACAECGGSIIQGRGAVTCATCGAAGRCANCGGISFGIERSGAERVAEWAAHVASAPVVLDRGDRSDPNRDDEEPGPGRVIVGTATTVKDIGPRQLDLVAILDPDRALVRPGIHAGERALATWMEASSWVRPRSKGGRVLAHTRSPGHPALQALIRWDPSPFMTHEAESRTRAGFPPNHPVFRIEGSAQLPPELAALPTETLLTSPRGDGTVCLVVVRPADLPALRAAMLRLAGAGIVARVVAEPHV